MGIILYKTKFRFKGLNLFGLIITTESQIRNICISCENAEIVNTQK